MVTRSASRLSGMYPEYPVAATTASATGRSPSSRAGPARNSFAYVSIAAGQFLKSSCGISCAGGPRTNTVPSTLPVGPEYAGSFDGFTTASTLALGIGDPLCAVAALADAVRAALASVSPAAPGVSRWQPTAPASHAPDDTMQRRRTRRDIGPPLLLLRYC